MEEQIPLKRNGSKHASADVRRKQILKATMKCFSEQGFHNSTIDMIAVEAGLSKGSIYRFYKSKHELSLAMFDYWMELVEDSADLSIGDKDPVSQIKAYCFAHIKVTSQYLQLARVWLEHLTDPEAQQRMSELYEDIRKKIIDLLEHGINKGVVRQVEPAEIADTLIVLIEGSGFVAIFDSEFNLNQRFTSFWQLVEDKIKV